MTQLQKYTWLIDTIMRAGKISHKELSARWANHKDLSDTKPLNRSTFNRWRDAIFEQFNIIIDCQKRGGYLYYIANPEDIDENMLKKWMLDSFSVYNTISENLSLKGRILVEEIPSGRDHLTTILEAMKSNLIVNITYHQFNRADSHTFTIEPYCVKLFENRWYVLGRNNREEIRIYCLDRMEEARLTDTSFRIPKDFDPGKYFSNAYGVVVDNKIEPERIVIRASKSHKNYLKSLPIHHSQHLIEDFGEYADFELYLSPTYDFVMRLLHVGAMIEVLSPHSLRKEMKKWTGDMAALYKND